MKKTAISVLFVALSYIATVYYIGSKTETVFQDYITSSNNTTKELYDVSVKLVSYNKSFLSSSAKVEIDVINPTLRSELVDFINLPIKSNFIVNHGPIFFHNQLTFGLAKVNSNIVASEVIANDYLEDFNKHVSGDVVLSTSIDFNLSGKIKAKSTIDGIDITSKSKNERLAFTPINIIIETDSNKVDSYKSSLQFKDFTINSDDFYVNVSGVRLDSNIQKMFGGIVPIGINQVNIDDIMIRASGAGLQPINLSIKSNTITSESNSKLLTEGVVNLTLKNSDKFSIPIPLDSINVKVKLFGLSENDIASLNNILSSFPLNNEDILLDQLGFWANNLLSGGDINYDLGVSATKDSNVVVNADIRLDYKGHKFAKSSLEETLLSLQKNVLDIVNADLEILVNKSLIKILNKSEADNVEIMLSGLINEGLIQESPTEYVVSASYKDRVAMVNKKNLSKDLLTGLVNLELIDLCNNIDGDWYYYYPPDIDYPDDVIFGKFSMDINNTEIKTGTTLINSVVLNLEDKTTTVYDYEEKWVCNGNKLVFEGQYEDGSTYTFEGVISFVDEYSFIWDDEELGEYTYTNKPPYVNLKLIQDEDLRTRIIKVIDSLTKESGKNPIVEMIDKP